MEVPDKTTREELKNDAFSVDKQDSKSTMDGSHEKCVGGDGVIGSNSGNGGANDTNSGAAVACSKEVVSAVDRVVTRRQLLPHETEQFLQQLHEDCLMVSGRGLCAERVLVALLHVHRHAGCLVLVLGLTPHETRLVCDQLTAVADSQSSSQPTDSQAEQVSLQVPSSTLHVLNAADTPPSERQRLYSAGGVLFVTARILLLDLLTDRCPVDLVTGVVVCRAHKVSESAQEAFILRLYRQKNKNGFIKAFTSSPVAFTAGYNHVERVMRNLFIPRLCLWPRFHLQVRESLSACSPDVVELHVSMTSLMTSIHTSLLDLINVSVKELRRLNTSLSLDELTVECVISTGFQRMTRQRFDPVWHQLSGRSRQLITDLRSLKSLLSGLLQMDCCAYYQLVANLQRQQAAAAADSTAVGWTMLDEAETVFVDARRRVFGQEASAHADLAHPASSVNSEKSESLAVKRKGASNNRSTSEKQRQRRVLKFEEPPKCSALMTALREIVSDTSSIENSPLSVTVVVFAKDYSTCCFLRKAVRYGSQMALWSRYLSCLSCRFGGADVYCVSEQSADKLNTDLPHTDCDDNEDNTDADAAESCLETFLTADTAVAIPAGSESEVSMSQVRVLFAPLKSADSSSLKLWASLKCQQPQYAVLYDIDVAAIRTLEVHQACNPQRSLRVYTLMFVGTVEEQAYLTELRVEKEAFEMLVRQKQEMIVPEDRDGRSEFRDDQSASAADTEGAANTRRGGLGSQSSSERGRVIVDSREFRCELPTLLYRRGLDIIPATIEVGDYIITPDVCVERKSINDLVGSLLSGRLYTQAENMVRHYKNPALLIEFDQDKPFNLQGRLYLSSGMSSHQLVSRLVLLTLHFPQLRIMWCPSPRASAELLHQLKLEVPEQPSLALARAVTSDADSALVEERFNPQIRNFISKLPGVDGKNLFLILNKINTLLDLVRMSKQELEELIGSEWSANRLYEALHTPLAEESSAASSSGGGIKRSAANNCSGGKSRQRPRFWKSNKSS